MHNQCLNDCFPAKRRRARETLEHHTAKRIQVATRVDACAVNLLRAHVEGTANQLPCTGKLLDGRFVAFKTLGDSEIYNFDAALFKFSTRKKNIGRFDVAVHNALAVRLFKSGSHLPQ